MSRRLQAAARIDVIVLRKRPQGLLDRNPVAPQSEVAREWGRHSVGVVHQRRTELITERQVLYWNIVEILVVSLQVLRLAADIADGQDKIGSQLLLYLHVEVVNLRRLPGARFNVGAGHRLAVEKPGIEVRRRSKGRIAAVDLE